MATWTVEYGGEECPESAVKMWDLPTRVSYEVQSGQIHYIYVGMMGSYIAQADPHKPTGGTGEFSMAINLALSNETYLGNMALCRNNTEGTNEEHPCDPRRGEDFYYYEVIYDDGRSSDFVGAANYTRNSTSAYNKYQGAVYKFKPVRPGSWRLYYLYNTPKSVGMKSFSKEEVNVSYTGVEFTIEAQGGVYALLVTGNRGSGKKRIFQVVSDNTVSILWQIPQIAIITAAEILFSITGYEFSYSQSGSSMKSVVQALWFLTTAAGDLIIVIMALMNFGDLALQALIFAGLMLVVIFIFALMSVYYYTYREISPDDDAKESDYDSEDEDDGFDEIGLNSNRTSYNPYSTNGESKRQSEIVDGF